MPLSSSRKGYRRPTVGQTAGSGDPREPAAVAFIVGKVFTLLNAQVRKARRLNLAKTGRWQTCPTFDAAIKSTVPEPSGPPPDGISPEGLPYRLKSNTALSDRVI